MLMDFLQELQNRFSIQYWDFRLTNTVRRSIVASALTILHERIEH